MKILIVDDEQDVGNLLQKFLSRSFEAVAVFDLSSAKARVQEWLPDLMILDNNLPDGSGIETIPQFLSMAPRLQIIAISAMGHLGDSALTNGALCFLEKPLSLPVLKEKILWANSLRNP